MEFPLQTRGSRFVLLFLSLEFAVLFLLLLISSRMVLPTRRSIASVVNVYVVGRRRVYRSGSSSCFLLKKSASPTVFEHGFS